MFGIFKSKLCCLKKNVQHNGFNSMSHKLLFYVKEFDYYITNINVT